MLPAGISSFFTPRPWPLQPFHQGKKIAGKYLAIERPRLDGQPNHQIHWRKLWPQAAKLLADNPFDPVAVDCPFKQFFADNHTETGITKTFATWLVVQHQQFSANRLPETKNG